MLAVPLVFVTLTLVESDTVQLTLRFEAAAAQPLLRPPPNAANCCEVPTETAADGGDTLREENEQLAPPQLRRSAAPTKTKAKMDSRVIVTVPL